MPVSRAYQMPRCPRTVRYRAHATAPEVPRADEDAHVITAFRGLVARQGRWRCWRCFARRYALGHRWNHKLVHCACRALGLNHVRRTKKRLPQRHVVPLWAPSQLNNAWAMGFTGDPPHGGQACRLHYVLDEGHRESLTVGVDVSLPIRRVVAVSDELLAERHEPRPQRSYNGCEFTAEDQGSWRAEQGNTFAFIQPLRPNQNANNRRLNRTFRHEGPTLGTSHPSTRCGELVKTR